MIYILGACAILSPVGAVILLIYFHRADRRVITDLQEEVSRLHTTMEELKAVAVQRNRTIEDRDRTIRDQANAIEELDKLTADLKQQNADLRLAVERANAQRVVVRLAEEYPVAVVAHEAQTQKHKAWAKVAARLGAAAIVVLVTAVAGHPLGTDHLLTLA